MFRKQSCRTYSSQATYVKSDEESFPELKLQFFLFNFIKTPLNLRFKNFFLEKAEDHSETNSNAEVNKQRSRVNLTKTMQVVFDKAEEGDSLFYDFTLF